MRPTSIEGLLDLLGLGPPAEQQVERALEAEALGLEEVLAAGPEGRAAVEVGRPLASPGSSAVGCQGCQASAGSIWSSVANVMAMRHLGCTRSGTITSTCVTS